MKKARLFIVVLVLAVMVPTVVYAAVGSFSSTSSTAAVTAKNTGSGRAVNATSNTGIAGVFARNATTGAFPALQGTSYSTYPQSSGVYGYNLATSGQNYGVYGRTNSTGNNATGVFGRATGASGLTNGLWGSASSSDGTGVYGTAGGDFGIGVNGIGSYLGVVGNGSIGVIGGGPLGVVGLSAGIADGTYGILSETDAAVTGHLVGAGSNLAGSCTIAATQPTSPTCTFADAFPDSNISLVVTPKSDPGGYWYTTVSPTGFTITRVGSNTLAVTFNYVVVGLDSSIASAGAKASRAARSATAKR